MDYKKTIDEYITNRYKFLIECSTNILLNNKTPIKAGDLVSELVLYLYDNEEKITTYINFGKLEGFCITYLNLNGKYLTSTLNKKYRLQFDELDLVKSNKLSNTENYDLIDMDDYERDLSNHFTNEQIKKILSVNSIFDKLTTAEQILFDAYFIKNLSYDKITKRYTFYKEKNNKKIEYKSKKSIYNMMLNLKNKIKDLIQNEDYD